MVGSRLLSTCLIDSKNIKFMQQRMYIGHATELMPHQPKAVPSFMPRASSWFHSHYVGQLLEAGRPPCVADSAARATGCSTRAAHGCNL
jgi:hypothetical protein